MQIYTNRFSFAMNQDRTEVVLNFFQEAPLLTEEPPQATDQAPMRTTSEPVANLVMTGQCAQNLLRTLETFLAPPSSSESSPEP